MSREAFPPKKKEAQLAMTQPSDDFTWMRIFTDVNNFPQRWTPQIQSSPTYTTLSTSFLSLIFACPPNRSAPQSDPAECNQHQKAEVRRAEISQQIKYSPQILRKKEKKCMKHIFSSSYNNLQPPGQSHSKTPLHPQQRHQMDENTQNKANAQLRDYPH